MNTELIARLETAEVGSRELDREIQSAAFGTVWLPYREGARKEWGFSDESRTLTHVYGNYPNPFTLSLDAALSLAERVLPGCRVMVERDHDGAGWAMLQPKDRQSQKVMENGPTPALALCISILRALDAQEKK